MDVPGRRGFLGDYCEAVLDTDVRAARAVVHAALAHGLTPEAVVFEIAVPSLEELSRLGAAVSLAQHFMAAQIASDVVDELVPRFTTVSRKPRGTAVIGTAAGDFHGLGKRIVSGCLKTYMVEVVDLGLSVRPERFVDVAEARHARVIAVSAMMVHTARGDDGCRRVRQLLRERGLEDRHTIVVGGAPYRIDPALYKIVGADACADDGLAAGKLIAELTGEEQR